MRWLPKLFNRNPVRRAPAPQGVASAIAKLTENRELVVRQTHALEVLASGVKSLSTFLEGGGLTQALSSYSKGQAINGVLNGLVSAEGRKGLDARFIEQNMVETFHAISSMYDGVAQRLKEQEESGQESQPMLNAEADFLRWRSTNEKE